MSFVHVGWAFAALADRPADRAVLMALLLHVNHKHPTPVYPSIAAIARWAGLGRSRTIECLGRLRADGWITVESPGGGRRKSTTYRIDLTRIELAGKAARRVETVHHADGNDEGNGPVSEPKPSSFDAETVRPADTKLGLEVGVKKLEPPKGVADGFAGFWEVYPRKDRLDLAIKAWNRLHPDAALCAEIMAGLRYWLATDSWTHEPERYIPTASIFLTYRRWAKRLSA